MRVRRSGEGRKKEKLKLGEGGVYVSPVKANEETGVMRFDPKGKAPTYPNRQVPLGFHIIKSTCDHLIEVPR